MSENSLRITEQLRKEVEDVLSELVGQPLSGMRRLFSSQGFSFGVRRPTKNWKGEDAFYTDWQLVASEEWRIEGPDGFVLCSDDFDPQRKDEHAMPFYKSLSDTWPIVQSAHLDDDGSLKFTLSDGLSLLVVAQPNSEEQWVLLPPSSHPFGHLVLREGEIRWEGYVELPASIPSHGADSDSLEKPLQESSFDHAAALAVLRLCAFCDPNGIPEDMLAAASGLDPHDLAEALKELAGAGILHVDEGRVSIQSSTQSRIRTGLSKFEILTAEKALVGPLEAIFRNVEDPAQLAEMKLAEPHAVALIRQAIGTGLVANEVGDLAVRVGDFACKTGRKELGLERYKNAALIARAPHGSEFLLQDIATRIGNELYLDGALRSYAESEELARRYGEDGPSLAEVCCYIGEVLHDKGDLEGALRYYREAERINRTLYGNDHPEVAISLINIGYLLEDTGDAAGAVSCFRDALPILLRARGPSDSEVIEIARRLAASGHDPVGLIRDEIGEELSRELSLAMLRHDLPETS